MDLLLIPVISAVLVTIAGVDRYSLSGHVFLMYLNTFKTIFFSPTVRVVGFLFLIGELIGVEDDGPVKWVIISSVRLNSAEL